MSWRGTFFSGDFELLPVTLTMRRTIRPMWAGEVRSPTPGSPAGCLGETGCRGLCVALRSAWEGEG